MLRLGHRGRLAADRFARLTGRGLRLHLDVTLLPRLAIKLDCRLAGCRLDHRIRYRRPRLGRLDTKQQEPHDQSHQQATGSPDTLFHVLFP